MFFDQETSFSASQVVTGAATVPSTVQLDCGPSALGIQLGNESPLKTFVFVKIESKDSGNTTPSINVMLCASADADFTASRVIAQTGVIDNGLLSDGTNFRLCIPPIRPDLAAPLRYLRVEYGLGNSDNSFTVTARLTGGEEGSPLFNPKLLAYLA